MEKAIKYLIVEDDPAFSKVLEVVTSKVAGIDLVGVCNNTVDAVSKITKEKPKIILLDVNISGLEGPEVIELIEYQPLVIVISSHPEEIMENYEIEYFRFIQKPLTDSRQLTSVLEECIKILSV